MAAVLIGTVTEDGSVYEIYAEETGSGGITFTIELVSGNGDLLGFFLDYSADATPTLGAHDPLLVTDSYFGDGGDGQDPPPPPPANDGDDVEELGSGNNVNGLGLVFDGALAFGTPGQGTDVDTVTFTIEGLTFDDIDGMNFAIRAQSTGDTENDSLKQAGVFDIPDDVPPPPVEVCLDGFSHGYWKTHQDTWDTLAESEYLNNDSYESIFGLTHAAWYNPGSGKTKPTLVAQDITLGQALALQGGGENALAREATAALLNATAGDLINGAVFAFDKDEIIAAVKFVYGYDDGIDGNEGVYNAVLGSQLHQLFEHWNTIHDDLVTDDDTPAWNAEEGWCIEEGSLLDPTAKTIFEHLGWT